MKTPAFAALVLSALAAPAAFASVTLSATPERVAAGQPVAVTVEIVGTGAGTFSSPRVPGLDRLAGDPAATDFTESSVAVEASSASVRHAQKFSVVVTPQTPGEYRLGPVTVGDESSSGVTVTVDAARGPLPAPVPAKPGDERVPADALELAAPEPAPQATGLVARWVRTAQDHPLPWIAGVCALALGWLALRTYSFLRRIEDLAAPATDGGATGPADAPTRDALEDGASLADQAVALVRARIARAAGRDVSHLAASELADLEPLDAKRALAAEVLRLADAMRFGRQVGVQDEVRKLLREYLA